MMLINQKYCLCALAALFMVYPARFLAAVNVQVDSDGTTHLPATRVPYSDLASAESKKNFIEFVRGFELLAHRPANWGAKPNETPVQQVRRWLDEALMIPGLKRLLAVMPASIEAQTIGGVQTDVIVPARGIRPGGRDRVLINLHGGGMVVGARYGGQMESVPIAVLTGMKVITVDYRMAPEWHFPAASEDVANVYRALLRHYRAENIGIYGCSSGADLTAQAVAWFRAHHLPRPGAIGLFGSAADLSNRWGDSNYISSPLMGWAMPFYDSTQTGASNPDYLDGANRDDPLVNPSSSVALMQAFPPTLLISGTRDVALSKVLHVHAQLVQLGVDAELHVWEGAPHCSFAQPVVDPAVPETQQAWDVISRFFIQHLGSIPGSCASVSHSHDRRCAP